MKDSENKFKRDLIFYFILFLPLVYFSWQGGQFLIYTTAFRHSLGGIVLGLSVLGIAFFYKNIYFYNSSTKFPGPEKIALLILPLITLLVTAPVLFSIDAATYLAEAKSFVSFHNNPFVSPAMLSGHGQWFVDLKDDLWLNKTTVYGPLSVLLASAFVLLGLKSLFITVVVYKMALGCLFLASIFLFKKITDDDRLTALYALNPVILISTLIDGHNDFIIVFFLLLAFYYSKKNKPLHAVFCFALSPVVKYTSIILLPLYFFRKSRLNPLKAVISTLIILAVIILCFSVFKFPFTHVYERLAFQNNYACYLDHCTPMIYLSEKFGHGHAIILRLLACLALEVSIIYAFLIKKTNEAKYTFWSFFILFFVYLKFLTPWYFVQMIPFGLIISKEKKYQYLVFAISSYALLHHLL